MIGFIRGNLLAVDGTCALVDVQGVGYEVDVPLGRVVMPDVGEEITFYTHFVVREDAQLLFGFPSVEMRAVFRDLIKLSGVGPKLALLVLSSLSIDDLCTAVYQQDIGHLVQIKGVGKKVAEKMLVELKDKVALWSSKPLMGMAQSSPQDAWRGDALEALLALGYPKKQAEEALGRVEGEASDLTGWVRLALQKMATPAKEGSA